jgi:hypothetical protein
MIEAEWVGQHMWSSHDQLSWHMCGSWGCNDSVDWARKKRICNPVAISTRWLEAGIDGYPRIIE